MAKRGNKGRKVRVSFKTNRQKPRRAGDLTRQFRSDDESVEDIRRGESVRAKGDLSRKRTILVDEDDAPIVDESRWHAGVVTTIHGLVCRVDDDHGNPWDCTVRRVLRTMLIEQRSSVAVGDRVWFSDQSEFHDGQPAGVIERVAERSTRLSRRERRGREHTLVANADQLLIVSSVAEPRPKPHLIDRYLVAAGKGDLRPVIVFNKCDLHEQARQWAVDQVVPDDLPPDAAEPDSGDVALAGQTPDGPDADTDAHELDTDTDELDFEDEDLEGRPITLADLILEYRRLGYTVLLTSAPDRLGLDALAHEFAGHTTVLSGQSGVGKSSLINELQPGLELETREVSRESEKGRHTTTHARLLRLDLGGYVVDTPGIRQFDLWNVEPGELELYFTEFAPLVQHCRFKDCHHTEEVGCAVRDAVDSGILSERRYVSYLKMLEEMAAERRRGY